MKRITNIDSKDVEVQIGEKAVITLQPNSVMEVRNEVDISNLPEIRSSIRINEDLTEVIETKGNRLNG